MQVATRTDQLAKRGVSLLDHSGQGRGTVADVKDLQRLVRERLIELGSKDRPLSVRDAAARANNAISHETIRQIAAGEHSGRMEDRTVNALAVAIDVPRSRVLQALHRTQTQPLQPFRLPERANRLGLRQRRAVLTVVDAMLDAAEGQVDDESAHRQELAREFGAETAEARERLQRERRAAAPRRAGEKREAQ